MASSDANASALSSVPQRLLLSTSMKAADLSKATLIPLDIDGEKKVVEESGVITSGEAIEKHTGKFGSILFVVRRPGCVLCREEGRALESIASKSDNPLDGFGIFGVVKEIKVDDQGLAEFHSGYFPRPLYCDKDRVFYNALGNRKMSIPWNPFKLFSSFRDMSKRHKDKGIDGNWTGEGLLLGGVIVFGKDGKTKYAYQEVAGSELPVEEILAAVNAVKVGEK